MLVALPVTVRDALGMQSSEQRAQQVERWRTRDLGSGHGFERDHAPVSGVPAGLYAGDRSAGEPPPPRAFTNFFSAPSIHRPSAPRNAEGADHTSSSDVRAVITPAAITITDGDASQWRSAVAATQTAGVTTAASAIDGRCAPAKSRHRISATSRLRCAIRRKLTVTAARTPHDTPASPHAPPTHAPPMTSAA